MIRVVLPYHLRRLSGVVGEVELEMEEPATIRTVLDRLESCYPALRGTIREHRSLKRRPFVRYYACEEDWSFEAVDTLLPDAVAKGAEPFLVVGAMAGG